ncbi:histone-lysine N-methyltransferase SETD1A [Ischnura elegans]|uniref:histone-lysine N-methyltransferase SETD1A n=1 Tax=Ischnura elegans TaxID=197161 RepID=UPI001ED8BF37|nr:histone-lysine N-methyltransferase SETD1A [Ischnura elegans]
MGQRSSRKQRPPQDQCPDVGACAAGDPLGAADGRALVGSAARPDEVVGFVPECAAPPRGQLPPPPWSPPPPSSAKARHLFRPSAPEFGRPPRSLDPPPPPPPPPPSRFGYEIQDLDGFLSQASLQNPANIPVVLASSCVLYQTQKKSSRNDYSLSYKGDLDCLQKGSTNYLYDYEKNEQIFLPLGMVVNAVFKNKGWLYVQTPHGEEGYVSARVCLPLGILPPPPPPPPVIRPIPSMPLCRTTRDNYWGHMNACPPNKTDTEKLRDTVSEGGELRTRAAHRRRRGVASGGGCRGHMRPEEAAVDRLFLKATAATSVASTCGGGRNRRGRYGGGSGIQRETLLLIRSDYHSAGCDTISVDKGDVVALVSHPLDDWFWVRAHDGTEGFIPSAVAGHGYI